MPVTYVITFDITPGKRQLFLDLLSEVLDSMRNEPTFHEAVLHVAPDNEDRMMLYETWESHDDVMTVQIRRGYREKWHAALPDILSKPRDISIWHPVRADGVAPMQQRHRAS